MGAGGLSGTLEVATALDVVGIGPARDALNAANRAINNTVDYTVSTGVLVLGWVAAGIIILALLAIIRSQNRRADAREKAQAESEARREKAAEERYRIESARMDRDIASRDTLAKALQELSVLMRSFKCIAPNTPPPASPRLLPPPEVG